MDKCKNKNVVSKTNTHINLRYAVITVNKGTKPYKVEFREIAKIDDINFKTRFYADSSLSELSDCELANLVGDRLSKSLLAGKMQTGYYEFKSEITNENVGLNVINDKEQIEKLSAYELNEIKDLIGWIVTNSSLGITYAMGYRIDKSDTTEDILFKVKEEEERYIIQDHNADVYNISINELIENYKIKPIYGLWAKLKSGLTEPIIKRGDFEGVMNKLSAYYGKELSASSAEAFKINTGKYSIKRNESNNHYFYKTEKSDIEELILINYDISNVIDEIKNLKAVYTHQEILSFCIEVSFVVTSIKNGSNKKEVKTMTYDKLVLLLNKYEYNKKLLKKLDQEVNDACEYIYYDAISQVLKIPKYFKYFHIEYYDAAFDECINKMDNALILNVDCTESVVTSKNGDTYRSTAFEDRQIIIYKMKK